MTTSYDILILIGDEMRLECDGECDPYGLERYVMRLVTVNGTYCGNDRHGHDVCEMLMKVAGGDSDTSLTVSPYDDKYVLKIRASKSDGVGSAGYKTISLLLIRDR